MMDLGTVLQKCESNQISVQTSVHCLKAQIWNDAPVKPISYGNSTSSGVCVHEWLLLQMLVESGRGCPQNLRTPGTLRPLYKKGWRHKIIRSVETIPEITKIY